MQDYAALRRQKKNMLFPVVALALCVILSATLLFSRLVGFVDRDASLMIPLTESNGVTKVHTVHRVNAEAPGARPLSLRQQAVLLEEETTVPANPGFQVEDENTVWEGQTDVEIFRVSYENGEGQITVQSGKGDKVIAPGTENEYTFTLQTEEGSAVLGGTMLHNTPEANAFKGYDVTADHMDFKMCKTPSKKKWDRHDLSKSDYTTEFKAGAKASFLIKLNHKYETSKNKITTLFVIRDEAGKIVSSATKTATWKSMWSKNYCELDIPQLPSAAGKYTIEVFFNGMLANKGNFTVTA